MAIEFIKKHEGPWVRPEDVLSPKDRVKSVVKVLYSGGENSLSVAILDYVDADGSHDPNAVAIRWNGTDSEPLGFPSVRQYPVWFLVPDQLASTIQFLAGYNFQFKFPFTEANAMRFMGFFGNMFSTESLTEELSKRGYKVTLEK